MFRLLFFLCFLKFVSPNCDRFFEYVIDAKETYGKIEIPDPDPSKSSVKVIFHVFEELKKLPNFLSQIDYGDLSMIKVEKNKLFVKLRFPIMQKIVPKVHKIQYNSKLLCSEPFKDDKNLKPITLVFDLTRFVSIRFNSESSVVTNRPKATTSSTASTYKTKWNLNEVCGETSVSNRVNFGSDASLGQFPWLVAYFYIEKNSEKGKFICGGSLISSKLIVTAAHCIHEKGDSSRIKNPQDSLFFVGVNDLRGNEKFSQPIVASHFHIHPKWKTSEIRYDNDIAIVVLSRPVNFNENVRPICIWTKTSNYEDMIERNGIVSGWGLTEHGMESIATAKFVKIPVIKDGTCLRKDSRLTIFTSENTFCAGKENIKNGPCKGDSGSAFISEIGSKSYLRGVVSVGIWSLEKQNCDLTFFSVFTDVAKYTSWIQNFITKYD